MEEIERHVQMSISDFETICKDDIELQANKSSDDATTLVEKSKNLNARMKQFRNSDIHRLIAELIKAANKMEETQITEQETPSSWIIKRKIICFMKRITRTRNHSKETDKYNQNKVSFC